MFFEFGTAFWAVLGTVVENAKHKKVAPGKSLNFHKKHQYLGPKNAFYQNVYFGASIESEGPGMVSS